MIRLLTGALAALLLHCTHGSSLPPDVGAAGEVDGPDNLLRSVRASHPLAGYEAHFLITWHGARIGDASETLRPHGTDGLRFERRERITVRRGDALAHSETVIIIDTDAALHARRVAIQQVTSGAVHRGEARRNRRGDWLVDHADEPTRIVPGAAVPAELVPLRLAARRARTGASRDMAFDGPVLLAGYGFATARLHMRAAGERALIATLSTPGGILRGRFFLARGGTVTRVRSDDGTGAIRVDAATAAARFTPPEIVDTASIPLAWPDGARAGMPGAAASDTSGAGSIDTLVIAPIPPERPLPPALPGQRIEARAGSWHVHLAPGDAGALPSAPGDAPPATPPALVAPALARLAERITAESNPTTPREEAFVLARAAATLLEDDLAVPAASARGALAQGRGDCTAHSLLFAALAQARGIPTRLVTGYRLDGDRLVRHRWAMVAVGGAWIAVDPTYGEAPAAPRLLGLAIHGPRMAELALADDLAFAGLSGARALACAPALSARPCGRSTPRTR